MHDKLQVIISLLTYRCVVSKTIHIHGLSLCNIRLAGSWFWSSGKLSLYLMLMLLFFPCRSSRRIRDKVTFHPHSEVLWCRNHGAGPGLYPHHGRPTQTTQVLPQWILHLQVHQDCEMRNITFCFIYASNSTNTGGIWSLVSFKVLVPEAQSLAWGSTFNCLCHCFSVRLSRLYLQGGSLYSPLSCTPTWRVVGWGQF